MEVSRRGKNKIVAGTAALGLGLAALAGCGESKSDWVATSPTAEFQQFGNMFVNGGSWSSYDSHKSAAENACALCTTAYNTSWNGTVVVFDSSLQVMDVYPGENNTAPTLRLTGFDGDYRTPLAPADINSQRILDTNNCQHLPLVEIPATD